MATPSVTDAEVNTRQPKRAQQESIEPVSASHYFTYFGNECSHVSCVINS
jgi:hypothetical protein